jgi:hypothetical protein
MGNEMAGVVSGYVKLWPREVFYIADTDCSKKLCDSLDRAGVYVLYQDFDAFYVGQSECLFDRLRGHAMKRYILWNHFSAFIADKEHLDDLEALMIAATPRTANRSGGKRIHRVDLPKAIEEKLIKSRTI